MEGRSMPSRRPHRQSRHGLYGRRRKRRLSGQPVEFGQLLFELEPLNGRPLDAL
jgi:hypothetical protein